MPDSPRSEASARVRSPLVLTVLAAIAVVAITTVGGLFFFARQQPLPSSTSTATPKLMGEAVPMGQATHVTSPTALEVAPGMPPSGGPHFAQPLSAGVASAPVSDGNAIHSLEHGLVWITYRADLIAAADLATLTAVARAHPRDVILSPRPENSTAATVVSWGRRLVLPTPVVRDTVEAFVTTNLDQSPEPGVR